MSAGAISELADRLRVFRDGISLGREWRAGEAMADVLGTLRRRHRHESRALDRARILETVGDYLHSGQVVRARNIFDLCLGAGWLDGKGKGILADRQLRRRLFAMAATATGRARRLKAFRSLLHAYWSFPLHEQTTPPAAIEGWKELRDWLQLRHADISRHPSRKPTWFNMLAPHLHLLEENPCARYAESLLHGSLDELQQAIDSLFIPADSWLKTEAVMAQIAAAAQWPDAAFRNVLPVLIKVAKGEAGIRVSAGVTRRAVAALLMRYARQTQHAAHGELFMLAIERIGNPWRQQSAWDAWVRDAGGHPCALAREMVNSWLRDSVIDEFFLDRGQEDSRSEFWLRFSVFMQAISVASPVQSGETPALLARMGEFLVRAPRDRDRPIEVYPWRALISIGGAKLLDQDWVDGASIRTVLDRCEPAMRMSQTSRSRCETDLRNFLFAKDLGRFVAVPPAPTPLPSQNSSST